MSDAASPVISVRGLNYVYPNGTQALKNISFDLMPDEIVGLVGPSGAGKSTFLLHLNGLLPEKIPAKADGETAITVQGLPMVKPNLIAIRQKVGLVFQDPDDQLFCPTVQDDLAFGPLNLGVSPGEVKARIAEVLDLVGMSGSEKRNILELSYGERKRICLAGVLACRPEVLILDEPFSNLDPRARRRLLQALRGYQGTILIVSHDLENLCELCQRILVIDIGSIEANGTTETILTDAALMEQHGLEVPLKLQLKRLQQQGHPPTN